MLTFTFSVPSIVSDTDKARAKGWRDFEEIMREGVWWFGDAEVKQLLKKITKRPKQGRPPEVGIQERLLDEYDAAVRDVAPKRLNKTEFARKFCKKYDQHSPQGVKKQLDRLLLYNLNPDGCWKETPASAGDPIGDLPEGERLEGYRLDRERLKYLADSQAVQIEELQGEIEGLRDWSGGGNGVAISNLAQIVGDSTASTRQRLRAAATVLNYQVADASVTEFAKGFLESLCADVDVAVDYRIEAGELLRRHEAPRVLSESVRPSYRQDAGTEAERVEAWRNYSYQQRKWKLAMDIMATSLKPDAPYRLPPGWCDDIYADDFVAPSGWPPW